MIYKQEVFVNDKGVVIHSRTQRPVPFGTPISERDIVLTMFHGVGRLRYQLPDGQVGQAEFEFEVPGSTIEEAFDNFPAAFEFGKTKAEADLRVQLDAQQRPRIVIPGTGHIH